MAGAYVHAYTYSNVVSKQAAQTARHCVTMAAAGSTTGFNAFCRYCSRETLETRACGMHLR